MLAEEIVGARIGLAFDRAMSDVTDDADDLVPFRHARGRDRAEVDAAADRILAGKILARERLVDHRDVRRVLRDRRR